MSSRYPHALIVHDSGRSGKREREPEVPRKGGSHRAAGALTALGVCGAANTERVFLLGRWPGVEPSGLGGLGAIAAALRDFPRQPPECSSHRASAVWEAACPRRAGQRNAVGRSNRRPYGRECTARHAGCFAPTNRSGYRVPEPSGLCRAVAAAGGTVGQGVGARATPPSRWPLALRRCPRPTHSLPGGTSRSRGCPGRGRSPGQWCRGGYQRSASRWRGRGRCPGQ